MEQSRRLSRRGRQWWGNHRLLINTKLLHAAAHIHSSYYVLYVGNVLKLNWASLISLLFFVATMLYRIHPQLLWWYFWRFLFYFIFFLRVKAAPLPARHYTATYLAILPQRVTNFCPGWLGMSSSKSYLRLWTLAAETTEIQSKSNLACDWLLWPPLN